MQNITKEHKAVATSLFERFFTSDDLEDTLNYFKQIVQVLGLKQGRINQFYPVLRQCILNNNAQSLFRILDEKRKIKVYHDGTVAQNLTTMIVGSGPCGLRSAIECQLMGSRVIMLEKRKSVTRNNVLHIWPFVIEDLKSLGVKVFFPKFCTGSMNHISIRRLQAVLVKVALVLGVEINIGYTFAGLIEPRDKDGSAWRVNTNPRNPVLCDTEIDVLIGAEGKHVTVPGFPRKEFRGKLAIAITANFANNHTTAEAVVEEISGVAFVYKQDFFNALYDDLGIALENIVYYKDETHYFVMTTKKHSLLSRGVLKKDHKDPAELLKPKNINQPALLDYIRDTCDYCTDYQLPNLKFALNHHGNPDVAMFDFTSMFQARNSVFVQEKCSKQLLSCLVGDGLLEPFWPTGTGAARGFLGAFDACWAIRDWALGEKSILQIIAEREAIFKLLPQTTPENIGKEYRRYTIDPATRYSHVNYRLMSAEKVLSLYKTDMTENGWRPPIVDNRRLARDFALASAAAPALKPVSALTDEFKHLLDQSGGANSSSKWSMPTSTTDPRRGLALQNRLSASAAGSAKPSLHDTVKKSVREDVKRLTAEQMAVLVDPSASTSSTLESRRVNESVGKLSSDALNCLLSPPSTLEAKERKVSAPGKLSMDQLAVLEGSSTRARKTSDQGLSLRHDEGLAARRKAQRQKELNEPAGPTRRRKSNDFTVDMELDEMLMQLEGDDDFQALTDNEKMAWLESLFFLDTKSSPRKSLAKVKKPSVDTGLRVNKEPVAPVLKKPTKPAPPPSAPTAAPTPLAVANESGLRVNDNLISLAQSYFNNEPKAKKNNTHKGGNKGHGQGHNHGHGKKQQSSSSKQLIPPKPSPGASAVVHDNLVPERAFFEPSSSGPGVKARPGDKSSEDQPAPPPPPRATHNKTAMLRLLSNATNIMKQ